MREKRTNVQGGSLYFITVHPDAQTGGHTYPSFDVAVNRARVVAKELGGELQIWRDARGGFERLMFD